MIDPTDVLKLPGNYVISANATTASNVTINSPLTVINGVLRVVGSSVEILSTQTSITGNILTLNSGEINNYVTAGTSGILIARGDNDSYTQAATLLYNDNSYWDNGSTVSRGEFEFSVDNELSAIKVAAIRTDPLLAKLNLLGVDNPTTVLSVAGTTDYESLVVDDDDIPNKKYVDSVGNLESVSSKQIKVANTFMTVRSPDISPVTDPFWGPVNKIFAVLGTSTNVVFRLEGADAQLQGLTITTSTINVNAIDKDLVLNPVSTGTGRVFVKAPLSLAASSSPVGVSGETVLYSTTSTGGGGTGLHFVNTQGTDELVSRRRAIIYGIIF